MRPGRGLGAVPRCPDASGWAGSARLELRALRGKRELLGGRGRLLRDGRLGLGLGRLLALLGLLR